MNNINGDKINYYLEKNIDVIYKKVTDSANKNISKEENFRTDMAIILNKIFGDLGVEKNVNQEQEYSVYNGRIDSLYGDIILEYKAPKKISNDIMNSTNRRFIEQVKRQILGLALKNKISKDKILGMIFDGFNIIYVKYKNNDWEISHVQKVTVESLSLFLKRLLSLGIEKKALIIENLLKDFDSNSKITKKFIKKMYYCYSENTEHKKVELLFQQWKKMFSEICGYNFETLDRNVKNLKNIYEIDGNVKLDYLIFSIQTYFALIIKFLSIYVLRYISSKKETGLNSFKIEDSITLKNQLEDMEQGGLYKKLGISNFLEGDFFGGYLHFWNNELYELIKEMIEVFENYDYSSINLEPELAKDLLKNVYHNLFPRELRHNLGEYYTPDWLAEFLIKKMDISFKNNETVLDPTCGSGTFIVLLINNYIEQNKGLGKKEVLEGIVKCIKGYDLNPLAVISARANYIISLGDLLNERTENIEIPIYLCDSMLTILEQKIENEECYILPTKAGNFPIPINIVINGNVNTVLDILNRCINLGVSNEEFIDKIINNNIMLDINEKKVLKKLFDILYDLEKKGLDGIWTNVIKNSFAPLFQKKVDYIIGNPPWIVWQSLPEDYRNSIQKYWYQYKIFEHKGLKARLGSSHDDLSVLMTYVIMDNFLKDKGKLGFVVNQNIFQSSGGGQGFRKFLIRDEIPIRIEEVDDFVKVQPFKDLGADNKTAVFISIKNLETTYPVKYNVWEKKSIGKIYANESLETVVNNKLKKNELLANPIKEYNSSWMIVSNESELMKYQRMISYNNGKYKARKGVDTSANAIYWIKPKSNVNNRIVFENSPETSKKMIKQVTDVVDEALVYPLVRGKDIYKWRYETPYSIIIPYSENGKVISKKDMKDKYENTYNYFYNRSYDFIDLLKNRGIVKKHFSSLNDEIPEYVLYDIGQYTFSKYKVVWKALASGMISTVLSTKNGKVVIPDHNVVMIPIDNEDEAYYLSGILNSSVVTNFVNAYISWFFSTHIIENMNIPEYDDTNEEHQKIVELSKIAHSISHEKNKLTEIEMELNKIVENILLK